MSSLRIAVKNEKSLSPIRKMDTSGKISTHCMDEPALILETQHGDLASFNHLVLAYQDSIFNIALRIFGDAELAADATQEAFISAFRGIKNYRGGSFKAWLMRIVTNACYDELRRQKRHPTLPLEPNNDDGEELDTSHWLADSSMLPEDRFEATELERAIQHCLEALPIDFRTVVVLVDFQGMDYSEAASATRVPLGTVKSRLARARLRLQGGLQEFGELLPAAFRLETGSVPLKLYAPPNHRDGVVHHTRAEAENDNEHTSTGKRRNRE
jgi:RNA polymerase sigma-70 factor (ECF subfamily)